MAQKNVDLETVVRNMALHPSLYKRVPTVDQLQSLLDELAALQSDALAILKLVKIRLLLEAGQIDAETAQRAVECGCLQQHSGLVFSSDEDFIDDTSTGVYERIHEAIGNRASTFFETEQDKEFLYSPLFSAVIFTATVQLSSDLGIEIEF